MPSIAGKISRWLAKEYYSTRERCSKDRFFRLLPLFFIYFGVLHLYSFVSGAALRLGLGLVTFLNATGSVLLGAYFASCCYARPRGRLFTALVSSLLLLAPALLSVAAAFFALRLAGWAP